MGRRSPASPARRSTASRGGSFRRAAWPRRRARARSARARGRGTPLAMSNIPAEAATRGRRRVRMLGLPSVASAIVGSRPADCQPPRDRREAGRLSPSPDDRSRRRRSVIPRSGTRGRISRIAIDGSRRDRERDRSASRRTPSSRRRVVFGRVSPIMHSLEESAPCVEGRLPCFTHIDSLKKLGGASRLGLDRGIDRDAVGPAPAAEAVGRRPRLRAAGLKRNRTW